MLLCAEFRVLQVTLHLSLRNAIDQLSTHLVETAIEVGHSTLARFGCRSRGSQSVDSIRMPAKTDCSGQKTAR